MGVLWNPTWDFLLGSPRDEHSTTTGTFTYVGIPMGNIGIAGAIREPS